MIEFILGAWVAFMLLGGMVVMTVMLWRVLSDIWRGDF
jgi:hypothetical protein